MGINWVGIVFGLGAVISFGYWTTDFLVVQRVLSARDLRAAKMAPVLGAAFKMCIPLIVVMPGLLALGVLHDPHTHQLIQLVGQNQVDAAHPYSYNEVLPLMLIRYCGPGLLGLGITALVAGFMSGMAGNVSAFSTVWTYDLYGAYMNKRASDKHYVLMGRWSTVVGMLVSIGTAYLVMNAASIMDYVQALFSFFIAPLFGTVILGMLWKRATNWGGFSGLLVGTASSICMWLYTNFGSEAHRAAALAHIALSRDAQPMANDMFRALWSWLICVAVTIIVSFLTKPKSERELSGLVYGATVIPDDGASALWQRPVFWAWVIGVVFIGVNLLLW
jgi:SSS family solute:Na+ symporter